MSISDCIPNIRALGITSEDAYALRRIAMTLHRWHELECGTADGGAIERDEATGKPYWTYDAGANGQRGRYAIPDREKGAIKRLNKIMAKYSNLAPYIQGDCRGAPLYILRESDVPAGESPDSYYSRGVAVYK